VQVWGAVAGCVIAVSACLYCIERLSPFSARNVLGRKDLGVLESFWLIYGSYMEQGISLNCIAQTLSIHKAIIIAFN
jgi:hypothetical protein